MFLIPINNALVLHIDNRKYGIYFTPIHNTSVSGNVCRQNFNFFGVVGRKLVLIIFENLKIFFENLFIFCFYTKYLFYYFFEGEVLLLPFLQYSFSEGQIRLHTKVQVSKGSLQNKKNCQNYGNFPNLK